METIEGKRPKFTHVLLAEAERRAEVLDKGALEEHPRLEEIEANERLMLGGNQDECDI